MSERRRAPVAPGAVIRLALRESFTDRTMMVAGGLSFFILFSLLPAIAVAGLVFHWVVGASAVEQGLADQSLLLPEETPRLLQEFLTVVPESLSGGFGLGLNLLVVFWTVQRASSGLITALNVVYEEDEGRGRAQREVVALAIAGFGMIFLIVALLLLAVAPGVGALSGAGGESGLLFLRWPLLTFMFFGAVALLYRFAACRREPSWRYILLSAAAATAVWVISSLLFIVYMNNVGGWDQYYGTVTPPVVLMTWIFISSFVLMLCAELNAQLEAAAFPEHHKQETKEALDRREHVS